MGLRHGARPTDARLQARPLGPREESAPSRCWPMEASSLGDPTGPSGVPDAYWQRQRRG
jgi:hypothetical protein